MGRLLRRGSSLYRVLKRASFLLIPLVVILFFAIGLSYFLENRKTIFTTVDVKLKSVDPKPNSKQIKDVVAPVRTAMNRQETDGNSSIPSVVIDPAHGGDDTGFVGYHGAIESQTNLQFSFMLARELRMKGVRVFLTRTDDKNVSIEKKIEYVKGIKPLLYLSINCAYSSIKTIRGMELFAFTPEQAGDEFENSENNYYEAYEGRYLPKTEESMVLEQRVARGLKKDLDLPYKSGLERKFLKLLAVDPQTAGLSLFIGYISNIDDVKKLSNPKSMEKMAQLVAESIEKSLSLNAYRQ